MNLSIASWNINGVLHKPDGVNPVLKTDDPTFKEYADKYDIIGLLETKTAASCKINIDGFHTEQVGRKISKNGRFFGGICVAVKDSIKSGVSVLRHKGETEFLWVKLDKDFFKLEYDYYICFFYASPNKVGNDYGIEAYERLMRDVSLYNERGKCLVLGDMNAHTGTGPDFVGNDDKHNDLFNLPKNYLADIPLNRRNCDHSKINEHGEALLNLCISTGMRILNGRKLGDLEGRCSYFGPMCKDPTLIDYGLVHHSIFSNVCLFRVDNFCHLSDHCPIYCHIITQQNIVLPSLQSVSHTEAVEPIPRRFVWEETRKDIFVNNLCCDDLIENIDTIDVDAATNMITEALVCAAKKSFRCTALPNPKRKPKTLGRHFDKDCRNLLRDVKKMSRKLSNEPSNASLRRSYYYNRKYLKKVLAQKIRDDKHILINKLSSHGENPREFWKTLEKLNECSHGIKKPTNPISSVVWREHFSNLMKKDYQNLNAAQLDIAQFVENAENWKIFNELSYKITHAEIIKALKHLKSGKATASDLISNEMLKASQGKMLHAYHKLFNMILSTGKYPSKWNNSWLKPLHKGGDIMDPNRYRGISIMSCLGKFFCTILNNRLDKYLTEHNLKKKSQIGFEEKCRTSDHILTLKTLIDKYFQDGRKLYTCFIDFKKAFDSVWRLGLFYKLVQFGVAGPFGRLLQNIYAENKVQIKLEHTLTETITNNVGVKQGCVLSPTLFKIFISDLEDIFDDDCKPAKLYNEWVNCLLFADDVVLISESAEGLQNALDKLHQYCNKWMLNINTDKTKTMIMNKKGSCLKGDFTLGPHKLETVKSTNYLGLMLDNNGSFAESIRNLCMKALKAMSKLRHSLYQLNLSPKISLYLFDMLVRPILTYGAEVWGVFIRPIQKLFNVDCDNYTAFDQPNFEKLDLKFCKSILGVHKKSSNAAVRGELGRYPITIFILKLVVKNWMRIAASHRTSTLVYDAYLCNAHMLKDNKLCWLSHIHGLVKNSLGQIHCWDNQGNSRTQTAGIVRSMKYIFQFHWLNEINKKYGRNPSDGNKLRTYCKMKQNFQYEQYLDFLPRFDARQRLTKLRTSSHRLEIEVGRYSYNGKKRIPEDQRKCKLCTLNAIENEQHVLMTCPKYQAGRTQMFKAIEDAFTTFTSMDTDEKFIFLLSCFDIEIANPLSHMLEFVQKERGSL